MRFFILRIQKYSFGKIVSQGAMELPCIIKESGNDHFKDPENNGRPVGNDCRKRSAGYGYGKKDSRPREYNLQITIGQAPGDDIRPLLQGGCHMICFELDNEQENLLRDWQENHDCKYRLENEYRNTGSFSGADTFTFIPTTVEEIVIVKCACGAKIDLSPEHIFFQKLKNKKDSSK